MNRSVLIGMSTIVFVVLTAVTAHAASVTPHAVFESQGKTVAVYKEAASASLSPPGDYAWWYGCSPTAAGMVMGHYDVRGYNGGSYDSLVPGGQAEDSSYPSAAGQWDYLAQFAIASPGHVADFYGSGYLASGDDQPQHQFNSLADFMGTSQDSAGNINGMTMFYFWTDGAPLYESEIEAFGPFYYEKSGMYGIGEYVEYAGYDAKVLYNQYTDTLIEETYEGQIEGGFTFEQYVAEIDAGRPVIIHLAAYASYGHSVYAYGYDSVSNTVDLHDTWTASQPWSHYMTWGNDYKGMYPYGVTVLEVVPEPATVALLGLGGLVLLRRKRR